MLLGSMLAGMAFANAPVAAVHALAYPVGARFHVPHGLSNALVLPGVLRFNAVAAEPLYAEIAGVLLPDQKGDLRERSVALIDYLANLPASLELPTRLRDVGISHNHLPQLAEDAMKQQRLLINNPREVTLDDALAIYGEAL
jgi:alcohol dehydrogenase class IV